MNRDSTLNMIVNNNVNQESFTEVLIEYEVQLYLLSLYPNNGIDGVEENPDVYDNFLNNEGDTKKEENLNNDKEYEREEEKDEVKSEEDNDVESDDNIIDLDSDDNEDDIITINSDEEDDIIIIDSDDIIIID